MHYVVSVKHTIALYDVNIYPVYVIGSFKRSFFSFDTKLKLPITSDPKSGGYYTFKCIQTYVL